MCCFIFTILLEVLLSVDIALVLEQKLLHFQKQRANALLFGMWGAYIFRFIMIGLGTFLIKFM
jgi:predicted tellurium resistance membrane protein TerC